MPGYVRHTAAVLWGLLLTAVPAAAQEPVQWGRAGIQPLVFATFSIAAVDPRTREVGVAVTTRVPCVGNGVPWVRAGVGAVATQANTRTQYGEELLSALGSGADPEAALRQLLLADSAAPSRQVAVIGLDGRAAQHTGSRAQAWAGHRRGTSYVTQGNILVGPQVLEAVARAFEASEGSPRHLADRLIEALAAGQAAGGDARKGRAQSAAVVIADARPGRSRRSDGITANINVCEHAEPVAELRRVYDAISQTLGYRTLQETAGNDVWQLKVMLHALGYFRAHEAELQRAADAPIYSAEAIAAVDSFRTAQGLAATAGGSPRGLVDGDVVTRLWEALEKAGKAANVRRLLLDVTSVRR
ncbi:MAG: DUF1028 domain-containing protein [Gemmatimonadaceae bacterium]